MFHWPASFAESASSVFVRLAESMVFANGSIETDRRAVYSRKMVDKLHSCRRTTKLNKKTNLQQKVQRTPKTCTTNQTLRSNVASASSLQYIHGALYSQVSFKPQKHSEDKLLFTLSIHQAALAELARDVRTCPAALLLFSPSCPPSFSRCMRIRRACGPSWLSTFASAYVFGNFPSEI